MTEQPLAGRFVRAGFDALPLVIYRGATGGVPILLGLFIAHRWGLSRLGAYTVANAIVGVGIVITDWGCARWLPREFATAGRDDSLVAGPANVARIGLSLAFALILVVLFALGQIQRDSAGYVAILAPLWLILAISTNGVSARIVERDLRIVMVAVIIGLAVFLAGAILVLQSGGGPIAFVATYVFAKLIEAFILVGRRAGLLVVRLAASLTTLRLLWPFSIQAILGAIYARLSIFVVEHWGTRDQLNVLAGASVLQSVLLLLPTSLALLTYPPLSIAARNGDRPRMREMITVYTVASAVGMAILVGILAAAIHPIGNLLHLPSSAMPFTVGFVAASVTTVGTTITGVLLQALGAERLGARLSVITLSLAAVYQIVLFHMFGLTGVIAAMVASEVTSLVIFGRASLTVIAAKVAGREAA
ncbi:MAG TPA: hypothetical protein VF836_08110 [Gemmatimonadaceae bacterium]